MSPVFATNGGLSGAKRNISTVAASGIWMLEEQALAKRIGTWPVSGNPIPGLSPVLWYDFADEATVTTSDTEITAVASKGSRNWTLTKSSTGPQYVTGINGRKCLDWGSSGAHNNFMRTTDTTSTAIGEVYVVVDANFGSAGFAGGYAGLFTGTGGGAWYVLATNGGMTENGTNFDRMYVNGGASNRYSDLLSTPSIDNPAILRLNSSFNPYFNAADGFQIGNDRTNGNRGWCGLVGEYVVFSSALSSVDRDAVQAHLAVKWGITLV
jgi:hypothetical protein